MAKQIKAYVDVASYVEVGQGRNADPAELIASVLMGDDFGHSLSRLGESAVGATSPARVLSGPHGSGKSTLLALLFAIASKPNALSKTAHQQLRNTASLFADSKIIPIFVDPTEDESSDLTTAIRTAFAPAANAASAAGIAASDWEAATSADDAIDGALNLLPAEDRILLIVDGLSPWLRSHDKEEGRNAIAQLTRIAERTIGSQLSMLVALDEESLEGASNTAIPLLRFCQVEYIPMTVAGQIADRHLFTKDVRQRSSLGTLYDQIHKSSPGFRWSREEFIALYPLHPAVLEVSSALRRYAPSYSFLRFAAAAGNRAKGRRELSLIVLDEMFDTCEYELRKAQDLAGLFEIYDDFVNSVVPKLTDSQQRFWAKLVLKGLFLTSLAGRAVTARDLADTMMLHDEADADAGRRGVQAILTTFEERASQRFTIEGDGDARAYRLPTAEDQSGLRLVSTIAREIRADDPRISDALVSLGAARFPDWPAEFMGVATGVSVELPWRGTWRPGRLGFRTDIELSVIPPLAGAPLGSAADLGDTGEDEVDLDALETSAAAAAAPERLTVSYTASATIPEDDWEVQLVPLGAPIELRQGPPTLLLWIPGEPAEEDLTLLRRLVVLRSEDARLDAAGVEREELIAQTIEEGGLVFHHLYLEKGRFVGPKWEMRSSDQAARETLVGLLARVLDAPLTERYPQHPQFGGELDEASARLLIEKLFVGGAPTPNVQQAAITLAAPLGLAEPSEDTEGAPYRFNPSGETALSFAFNVEPLRLAEAAGDEGVALDALYQVLRREPFGLLRTAQRLIIAGLIGSGRLKLTGPKGELTAAGLETAGDLEGYTHLKRSGLSVYPNETLLDWARLVTEAEHLNDLVTSDGRQLIRKALEDWLDKWDELDLKSRFNEVPDEAATRRTWQLISASKQYFDSTSNCMQAILAEQITLEEGLGRIVTTFAANQTIYQRAVRDQKMLTSFIEWAPFYTEAKEYVLSADRTPEATIEAERSELIDFITAPHRLLEETKRRRFESVYESFQRNYIDYYASAHDLHVGSKADFDSVTSYLDGEDWLRFQLLSQARIVNSRYYQFAMEFIDEIRELTCELPIRELLRERPSCLCGFRVGNAEGVARMFDRVRLLVDQGTIHHIETIRQFRQAILVGMRTMEADSAYADASVPLISLLSSADTRPEVTPSTVDLINRCIDDQPPPVTVAAPPALEPGHPISKQDLRARLLAWLDELPGDDAMFIEVGRLLPATSDE